MHFGSMLGCMLLVLLFIKLKLKLADFAMFFILAVRCTETFLVFHLIDSSAPGFALVDRKELADAISFVAAPAQILAICNLKFNYLVTTPLTAVSIILVNQRAYTTKNDNMSCFANPENVLSSAIFRWMLQIMTMIAVSYMYRKSTLGRFIEQEKSKKQ